MRNEMHRITMSKDDEILRTFRESLLSKVETPAEVTREDLIERFQENFQPLIDFVESLSRAARETIGGDASVALDYGDFDENNTVLSVFIRVTPARSTQKSETIILKVQGTLIKFVTNHFAHDNGRLTYGIGDLDALKPKLSQRVSDVLRG
jgi:predicted HAD superfamily phosphohydrolase